MSIYRMTLRFNLEDETERKAAEFLKQLDRKEYKSKATPHEDEAVEKFTKK